jgi:hypothetical protein
VADQPADSERLLTCEICLKEIPLSAAVSAEGVEYVLYLCGAECYDEWHSQATEPEPER